MVKIHHKINVQKIKTKKKKKRKIDQRFGYVIMLNFFISAT